MKKARIKVKENEPVFFDQEKQWWFTLQGTNGRVIVVSETFGRKSDANRAAKKLHALMDPKKVDLVLLPAAKKGKK